MQYITIFDYILLPVYLYIFYLVVKNRSIKYTDPELRRYFFTAFFLRIFGAIIYAMLVQYYYGYGDSFLFYYGGDFLNTKILEDAGNIKYFFASAAEVKSWYDFEIDNIGYSGYFGIASNLFVMKISALLSFICFKKYLIITLFFGFFSFAGLWRLFLVFKDINKGKQLKMLAWAVLYLPSVWFWGSGLIKDSVCVGGMGFIIHFLYTIFIKKQVSIKNLLGLVFFIYVVASIKSYIIIVLAVSLSTFIFYRFVSPFKNIVIRTFVIIVFLFSIIFVAFITNFDSQLKLLAQESKVQVDAYQRNYEAVQGDDENSKGMIEASKMDASVGGLLLYSPVAIFKCLFRPYIWESRKIFILFSALEASLLLFCTLYLLYKFRFFRFFREIFSNPFLLFSFTMAILFALIIGFTTYNFGTMARYKIILLPFYAFLLVNLYTILLERKNKAG
jgi:hypothetical protein